jgi:FtsH-binding integral membrane protein
MSNTYDVETVPGAVWHAGVDARAQFISRTYFHLFGAISAFVLIEAILFKTGVAEGISKWMLSLPGGWLAVLGGFLVVGWIASHVSHSAQSLASQYAALAAYIVAEALIFVPLLYIADRYHNGIIMPAAVVTMTGFAVLTGIVFITRRDFSFLRGLMIWGGVCALGLIVAAVIMGFNLGPIFCVAMIAFAGAAILYDTSNVLHHYPTDRYVGASLSLFASVALLFWYVLRIFMSRD